MKAHASNNVHVESIHWVFKIFSHVQDPIFQPQKGGTYHEKRAHLGDSFFELGSPKLPKVPSPIPNEGLKEAHSKFWRGPKGSELAVHPVRQTRKNFARVKGPWSCGFVAGWPNTQWKCLGGECLAFHHQPEEAQWMSGSVQYQHQSTGSN